ncbi:PilC/PilY family type IV pilus protein, partial [bacterium]|nr:PilC/PilY family type IV pilus protein [bacterium]
IDGSGQRDAKSYERSSTQAPLLRVSYDPSSIPFATSNCSHTLDTRVTDADDDAEMVLDSTRMRLTSDDLEMPFDEETGNGQLIGVRFRDLDLPRGAIIDDAWLEFEVQNQHSSSISVGVYAELGNASEYTSNDRDLLSNRSYSSPILKALPARARGEKIRFSGLQAIVQQSVDSSRWISGGALAFAFSRNSGAGFRDLKSFEGGYAPALHIEYRGVDDYAHLRRARTARDSMKQVINEIEAIGSTPIIDTYFEASKYFLGGDVTFGKTRGPSGARHGFHRVSHPDSFIGGSISSVSGCSRADYNNDACKSEQITGNPIYVSPMIGSCQANHIVFLSDGEPSENTVASDIQTLTGVSDCESVNDPDGYKACGKELATWLQETDHDDTLRGPQNITTYTIGFNTDRLDADGQPADTTLLRTMASHGRGKFFSANDALSLTGVFRSIVGTVATEDTGFVSPGATVNQFNRLRHRNDIYFAQFKPNSLPTWAGNLKKYKIGSNASGDEIEIQDADGNPAVDERTGFFSSAARSYWLSANASSDGSNVAEGGASAELADKADTGEDSRKVYTFTGANDALPAVLATSANALSETNTSITDAMLGLQGLPGTSEERNAYKSKLLAWARGRDVLDTDGDSIINEIRPHIGDPMHSQPVIVNYPAPDTASENDEENDEEEAENEQTINSTVFVATNEGFLHAIDSESGAERFAFIPQELLSNLDLFFTNDAAQNHPYGLDGPMTFWHDDLNDNLEIDSGEKAMLFIGMRRGGSNYYAIDVSERDNPKLVWVIRGGANGDEDFRELGRTWSAAVPTKIIFEGEARDVLVFGGGYDLDQDPESGDSSPSQNADDI